MRQRDFWRMRKAAMRLGWVPADAYGVPRCELCNAAAKLALTYFENEPVSEPRACWACAACRETAHLGIGGGR